MINENPLVTVGMAVYNQREYVLEALESIFAQTYSPLEIVIQDDHSTDGSDDIVRKAVEEYRERGGRHAIIFNRNEKNVGIMENTLKLFSLAHGELMVECDGDDIAYPNKVETIVREWLNTGKKATMIWCGGDRIDKKGRMLTPFYPPRVAEGRVCIVSSNDVAPWFWGAFHAWSMDIVKRFGGIDVPVRMGKDYVLGYRALMLGPQLHIKDRLMKYRLVGVSQGSPLAWRKVKRRNCNGIRNQLQQAKLDLEAAKGWLSLDEIAKIQKKIGQTENWLAKWDGYLNARSFRERLEWVRRGAVGTGMLPFCFPKPIERLIMLSPPWLQQVIMFVITPVMVLRRRIKGKYWANQPRCG